MKKKTKETKGQKEESQAKKGKMKLGLDVHYRQVTVAMQEGEGPIKAVGKMSHERFEAWLSNKQQEWELYSCYEAGASGYWLHRELTHRGVNNVVVVPQAMGGRERQKTDRRDSVSLCDSLDRYLRGNKSTSLQRVQVPSQEVEEHRATVRFHRQLVEDQTRNEARGKGVLCAQGIEVKGTWWSEEGWKEVLSHPRFKASMKERLNYYRKEVQRLYKKQKEIKKKIEEQFKQTQRPLPKGCGLYSSAQLEYEMKGMEHFNNRRQVGSYTGLCPGVHSSNGRGREGSINHCGNKAVRWTLVEMVWRMMRYQPHYKPIEELVQGLVKSRRAKKKLVVKAARRLGIDLWRLWTGRNSAEELGFVLN
jgi:transposase